MAALNCVNNANETCQNNYRIKYQANIQIDGTYNAGIQSFTSTIEVKKHVVSFMPMTHQFILLGTGAMYQEDTYTNIEVFDANGVFLDGEHITTSFDEALKCANCHQYAIDTINSVIANLISNGVLVDTHTLPNVPNQHLGAAITNSKAYSAIADLLESNNAIHLVDTRCQLDCGIIDIGDCPNIIDLDDCPGIIDLDDCPDIIDLGDCPGIIDIGDCPNIIDLNDCPDISGN